MLEWLAQVGAENTAGHKYTEWTVQDPFVQTDNSLVPNVYTTEVPYRTACLVSVVQGRTVWKMLLFWFSKYFFLYSLSAFLNIHNTDLYLSLSKHSFSIFKVLLFLEQSWNNLSNRF